MRPLAAAVLGDEADQRRGELLGLQTGEHPGRDRVGDQERALAVERAGEPSEVGGHVAVEEAGGAQHRAVRLELAPEAVLGALELLLGAGERGLDVGDPVVMVAMVAEVRAVVARRIVEPFLERPRRAPQRLVASGPGSAPALP